MKPDFEGLTCETCHFDNPAAAVVDGELRCLDCITGLIQFEAHMKEFPKSIPSQSHEQKRYPTISGRQNPFFSYER